MTNKDEIIPRQLLGALAQVADMFRDAAVSVEKHNKVLKTLNAVEFMKSTSGPMLTGYLDAELKDGTTLSWLLDVAWTEESWTIEARLLKATNDLQETVQELPTDETNEFDQFRSRLLDTTRRLLSLRASPLD